MRCVQVTFRSLNSILMYTQYNGTCINKLDAYVNRQILTGEMRTDIFMHLFITYITRVRLWVFQKKRQNIYEKT